jgi:hypothetical protein
MRLVKSPEAIRASDELRFSRFADATMRSNGEALRL